MARSDKAATVAALADEFRTSNAAVLTEYRGLTVAQLQQLRRSLGDHAKFAVVKNTLTKIAAKEAGITQFDELLDGPSAIAFVKGDPVEAAKGLRDFAKTVPLLVIKGGVLDGKPMSADEIKKLAELESRDVLLARLAGAMRAGPQKAVSLFVAPLSQMVRLAEALRQKADQDPGVLAGGAGAPTPATATEEATADRTSAESAPAAEDRARADVATEDRATEDRATHDRATEDGDD